MQIGQALQRRKTLLENVNIDWNLSQDEAGSIDLSDEDTVIENSTVSMPRLFLRRHRNKWRRQQQQQQQPPTSLPCLFAGPVLWVVSDVLLLGTSIIELWNTKKTTRNPTLVIKSGPCFSHRLHRWLRTGTSSQEKGRGSFVLDSVFRLRDFPRSRHFLALENEKNNKHRIDFQCRSKQKWLLSTFTRFVLSQFLKFSTEYSY